ncbi:galactose mutarotase [Trifolium repens]|nr:galactose mutarotase [Trifolium repens]
MKQIRGIEHGCQASVGFVNGSIKKEKNYDDIKLFELKKGDLTLKVTNWGATLVSLILPDKNGKLGDIVLGYDTPTAYTNDTSYFGATVGRVANRIGGAQFTLNGIHYKLIANEGNNTLHGGPRGFSDVLWKVKKYVREGDQPQIKFSYHSFDGEEGFPGDLKVTVRNHNSGNILDEVVQIFGSKNTVFDDNLIPTGKISSVKGTPNDFLKPQIVGTRINQLPKTNGYNVNYVLNKGKLGNKEELKVAAIVFDKKSGRVMKLSTNAPGLQFYTANFVKNDKGKGGFVYQPRSALCLESQAFPDSVNHPNFPSTIVTKEKPYKHVMLLKFSTKVPDAFSQF